MTKNMYGINNKSNGVVRMYAVEGHSPPHELQNMHFRKFVRIVTKAKKKA